MGMVGSDYNMLTMPKCLVSGMINYVYSFVIHNDSRQQEKIGHSHQG